MILTMNTFRGICKYCRILEHREQIRIWKVESKIISKRAAENLAFLHKQEH